MLIFPNDTSWFEDTMLDNIRRACEGYGIGSFTAVDSHGPKFVIPKPGTRLNKRNVWLVIEPAFFVRCSTFKDLGGFDTSIGTGASTPWQAGEVGDLILTLIDLGNEGKFAWLDTHVYINGVTAFDRLSAEKRRRKIRAYGRGFGYVVNKWRYPLWFKVAIVGHGALSGVKYRKDGNLLDGYWVAAGRIEGLLGRTFGRTSKSTAVDS
jgi:hypothetical protein